jgi:hypothetical protein
LLDETGKQFTAVFNAVCAFGWQQDEKNGVRLHHATYYQTRAQYPHLNANLLIQARIKATEALKSAFDRRSHQSNLLSLWLSTSFRPSFSIAFPAPRLRLYTQR